MKQLVCGNQQCPETVEELQQQVEVATATMRGTPVVFYLSTNILRRSEVCIATQGQEFQHFL